MVFARLELRFQTRYMSVATLFFKGVPPWKLNIEVPKNGGFGKGILALLNYGSFGPNFLRSADGACWASLTQKQMGKNTGSTVEYTINHNWEVYDIYVHRTWKYMEIIAAR